MSLDAPEMPPRPARPSSLKHRIGVALVALSGWCLCAIAVLMLLVATLFGPGNEREALVDGGPDVAWWFGLPGVGAIAAVVAMVWCSKPREAFWPLLVAALCLGGWAAATFLGDPNAA